MFPPIKVSTMNLSACKRIVLFNAGKTADGEDDEKTLEELDESDLGQTIEFRHYGVSAR